MAGIILCGEPPAAVNEGEVVVASNGELHAAQLSGQQESLLAGCARGRGASCAQLHNRSSKPERPRATHP
jgi:hypothetical protein